MPIRSTVPGTKRPFTLLIGETQINRKADIKSRRLAGSADRIPGAVAQGGVSWCFLIDFRLFRSAEGVHEEVQTHSLCRRTKAGH